jgi:hypothetical protein
MPQNYNMSDPIVFRCPYTGMNVQSPFSRELGTQGIFESVSCPICTRLHLVDKSSGRVAGEKVKKITGGSIGGRPGPYSPHTAV